MQMLAIEPSVESALAADAGKLCAKKDVILAKFDQLLNKLHAQSGSLNATDTAALEVSILMISLETHYLYQVLVSW